MNEAKYTWDDIIFNPHNKRAENAVGRECYFDNNPGNVLGWANTDDTVNILPLKEIEPNSAYPFIFDGVEGSVAFSCIVVKKEVPYSERAKKWIEENDLKVGDYVKVLRKTEPHENGWGDIWCGEMNDHIGEVLKVLEINSLSGLISMKCYDTVYDFPYFVLEKVEPPKPPKYVPFESKEEFIEAFHYHDTAKYSETDDILLIYGMWLRCKKNGGLFQVVGFLNDAVYLNIRAFDTNFQRMLDDFEFLDGTPCGKEVKDE